MNYIHRVHEGDDPWPGLTFHRADRDPKGFIWRLRIGNHVWRFRYRHYMKPHFIFSYGKYNFSWTDPAVIPEALPELKHPRVGPYWAKILGIKSSWGNE